MASVFFLFPLGVLFVSFIAVCLHTGTVWPWTRVVHEDGLRTLLGTIFYFEHAVRELPLDLIMAAAVAGAFRYFYPRAPGGTDAPSFFRERLGRQATLAALLIVVVMTAGAAASVGFSKVADNLAQMHTRAGAPLVFGNHWRYHLLERLALIFLAFACAGLCRMLNGFESKRGSLSIYGAGLAIFGLLTFMFRLNYEPFQSPVYLGHQAREFFTHLTVSLPLAAGACLYAAGPASTSPGQSSARGEMTSVYGAAAAGGLIGLYLITGTLLTDAGSQAQTESLVPLVFGHYFEHSFTYLLTPLVAVSLYVGMVRR